MEFRILGPVEMWDMGSEIPIDGPKERTVLAALLLAKGRTVSDAVLLDLLWGESPPKTYTSQLYTYISRLRKRFGTGTAILRQHPGYLIKTGDGVLDSDLFERYAAQGREALRLGRPETAAELLGAALALWRGPALANVSQSLIDAEADRLEEARMAVLENRIEADLALGRHSQLVSELSGLVVRHPLHERLRAHLMTALYRCGRQGDAMSVYQDGCRILSNELGVYPGRALREAHQFILHGRDLVPSR
ncbi:AfsR/SARP family transcriptional regulator [Actinospica robiniae]|uniref:AfsR/SARP family transcriptional regulator n=1 Tax=Actinospica robiniae TaxID=304901 RepID=UPI0003FEC06B|nr:AfsR/SARP family transcriptional regulator [Actinospica robiniae]